QPELSTSTLKNVNTLTDIGVESTSTFILTNKGKASELIISLVNKESLDYDQSFDIAENMLDKNNRNNALHFEHETEASIFFAIAQKIFFPQQTK
ncbi:9370_t:CDS:1, partial [Funneliformis geosporum]